MHSIGEVPTFKMHNVGTVPTFRMHNVGTVPRYKTHNVGTSKFYCQAQAPLNSTQLQLRLRLALFPTDPATHPPPGTVVSEASSKLHYFPTTLRLLKDYSIQRQDFKTISKLLHDYFLQIFSLYTPHCIWSYLYLGILEVFGVFKFSLQFKTTSRLIKTTLKVNFKIFQRQLQGNLTLLSLALQDSSLV